MRRHWQPVMPSACWRNLRLRVQKTQTPVTTGALVPLKEVLIRQAMNEIGNIKTMHSRRSYVNADAYTSGQTDGGMVGINKGVGTRGATRRQIGK